MHTGQISSTSSFLHSNGHVLQAVCHILQLVYLWLNSMEVGVCAEAYQGEEPLRHINSAFMTFEVLDENGRPRPLPPIKPEPQVRNHSANDHSLKFQFRPKFLKVLFQEAFKFYFYFYLYIFTNSNEFCSYQI